MGIRDAKKGRP